MKKIIAFVAFTCICPALGFLARLPSSPSQLMPSSSAPSRRMLVPLDSSTLLTSLLQTVDKQQANAEFFFFFFGGSGALGIGGAQVPKLLALNKELQARKGGLSEGGADLNANPIATFGYPETLKEKDIMKIIKEMPSVDKISSLGVKKSYMSQLGYLEREGFDKSLPKCNPVAMYGACSNIIEVHPSISLLMCLYI